MFHRDFKASRTAEAFPPVASRDRRGSARRSGAGSVTFCLLSHWILPSVSILQDERRDETLSV